MNYYAGLDVSMKETFICIQDETGKIIYQGRVKTDPELIARDLMKLGVPLTRAALESGSLSHFLVEELKKLHVPVICIDARRMAAVLSLQVNKTDQNDAKCIADAVRCNLYREVVQKSEASIAIGTLMGCRRVLVGQKIQQSNAIRGFLKIYGIRLSSMEGGSFIEAVRKQLLDKNPLAKEGVESLIECYEKICLEIKKLTKKVEELARNDEDVKRLMTIPGIGAITALAFKIEIDDPRRFKNSRSVGAYLGMTPKQYSSGETKRQGQISKCGSVEMRSMLMEAGIVMMTRSKKWSKVKAWGLKLMRKNGAKKAAVAVGRKLAVIMHRMLIDKRDFIHGEPKEEKIGAVGLARAG